MRFLDLQPAARTYVEDRLESGITLSSLIAQRLSGASFRARVALPEGASMAGVEDLRSGGKTPPGISRELEDGSRVTKIETTLPELVEMAVRYGSDPEGAFLLLENRLASPGDPWLERLAVPTVFHGAEVYHLLLAEALRHDVVAAALRAAFRPPGFAGVLGKLPGGAGARPDLSEPLAPADLTALASAAELLVVDAFDGESFVLVELAAGAGRAGT